ncbi:MAG: GDYXXLXY domain-containing protein [Chitinophagaceae bacterium]|nr:GDYXXLXY domain-containing protein [Chitinophagaceae bacterium]
MLKGNRWLILLNLALFAGFIGFSVQRNEHILSGGRQVFLELTPIDPRSLMQGDYMQLAYRMADLPVEKLRRLPSTGYCVITLDDRNIGSLKRFQSQRTPLAADEILIPYHNNRRQLSIGAEAYFFQENQASTFEPARYGCLRVGENGVTLLTGLCDGQLNFLK